MEEPRSLVFLKRFFKIMIYIHAAIGVTMLYDSTLRPGIVGIILGEIIFVICAALMAEDRSLW
jgi:hypothetical protein